VAIENDLYTNLIEAGFSPTDLLLVGVSGGPDSLVLAYALKSIGWKIALAYFDHRIRPESARDGEFVKQIAQELNTDFFQGAEPIPQMAKAKNYSIEKMARERRYHFLFRTAEQIGAKAVLTAHTADDQVETILMHLLRGSGLSGLCGMQIKSESPFHPFIPLVRPLLNTWREEIDAYCQSKGLEPIQDATNREHIYFRNRVRLELIPVLQKYNPAIKEKLIHMADILRDDFNFLEKQYERVSQDLICSISEDTLTISRKSLATLDRGAQKAILKKALAMLEKQEEQQVEYAMINDLLNFAKKPTTTHHISLAHKIHAFSQDDALILTRCGTLLIEGFFPQCSEERSIALKDPFEVAINPSLLLRGRTEPVADFKKPRGKDGLLWEIYVDAEKISSSSILSVRPFRAGERYTPLGMHGHQVKVSDFFTNKKVLAPLRKSWPLLVVDNTILWIIGFQPSHIFRVQQSTQRVWHFQILPD